jgi:hypothetical protein
MKKQAMALLISLTMISCSDGAERVKGLVMIGNKPYKMVYITLDGSQIKTLIPADSSVSVIPANATYQEGKTTTTTIVVP